MGLRPLSIRSWICWLSIVFATWPVLRLQRRGLGHDRDRLLDAAGREHDVDARPWPRASTVTRVLTNFGTR